MAADGSSAQEPVRGGPRDRAAVITVGVLVAWAAVGPLYLALPGAPRGHAALVFAAAAVALADAAVCGLVSPGPRATLFYSAVGAVALATLGMSVASTGGAGSPVQAAALWVIAIAWFVPQKAQIRMLTATMVADLLVLFHDGRGISGERLGWTLIVSGTLAAASVAVVNARRRFDRIGTREAGRIEMIVALHREIENAEFDVDEVVPWLLEKARTLLGASAASAGILDGDTIEYRYRTGPGMNSGEIIRTPRKGSLSGLSLDTGEVAYCADSEVDPRVDKAACRRQNLRSMIIVPLRRGGESVGVLNVNSPIVDAFSHDDIGTVELVGGAISAAYGHAVDLSAKRGLLSELRESQARLSHQALHDPLTGLPNRTLFMERLNVALVERGDPEPAVLFVDLDGFKEVNDTLGHEAGDALLTDVAQRITGVLRAGETAARLGGDEFAILCKAPEPELAAVRIAERVLEALHAAFAAATNLPPVTASIGISTIGASSQELLRNADDAMYRAKAGGKAGYAVYAPPPTELAA